MASLLSAADKTYFTGAFGDFVDTFIDLSTIVVFKEPIKTIASSSVRPLYGYGNASVEDNFTYTVVSGSFGALLTYPSRQIDGGFVNEIENRLATDELFLEVKQNARDYILNGKTEKIVADDKSYTIVNEDLIINYLTYTLYGFKAKLIK